ncbi:MAG: hypothetical protein OEW68_09555 [Gammaproteobacteria bacterium]|nr:hypothetical protein [Gammaproteobacteria bacterium]MDH4315074.1 hypothetical protein [Gammaproteobacteria bacterium]MDH5214497.1 hypothetical protein [Gammaproteobacteria bacterium]MDH5500791.1 hypothetical protein [Gammaproteobacteria bacterium]
MQDSKDLNWSDEVRADQDNGSAQSDDAAPAREEDGWQQYRKWISKAPAPKGRRTGIDPTLYTWKGYRNWTEQVKRNWSDS